MQKSEIRSADPRDLFLKAHSTPSSFEEVREGITRAVPETEIFFRLATRDDRDDGLYIQFLPVRPVSYSLSEFGTKLSGFAPETRFLVVFQKARKGYCPPTLYISQLVPIPKRVQ